MTPMLALRVAMWRRLSRQSSGSVTPWAHGQRRAQAVAGAARPLEGAAGNGCDEAGDHAGIDLVVLGDLAERLGEAADAQRVEQADGEAALLQGAGDALLVAAGGFQADGGHL